MWCLVRTYLTELQNLLDKDVYVPCQNLPEMTMRARPLSIILRKQESSFFNSSFTYEFTEHSLTDIVDGLDSRSSSLKSALRRADDWENFSPSSVKVAGLADLKVKELDNLDDIIDGFRMHRFLHQSHELWKHVTDATEKFDVMCITGVVYSETCIDFRLKKIKNAGNDPSLEKLRLTFMRYWNNQRRSLKMPEVATLLYKFQPLDVDPKSGRVSLPVGTMCSGRELTVLDIDPEEEIENCQLYYSMYCGKLSSDKQAELSKAFKELLTATLLLNSESDDRSKVFVKPRSACDGTSHNHRLVALVKMAKAALPTTKDPKEKEIGTLLTKLGIPKVLDLNEKNSAVYGIYYFFTALLSLPPEALVWLSACASKTEEPETFQTIKELKKLLYSVVRQQEYKFIDILSENLRAFISIALLTDEALFVYAWRAAYVSAIYLCDLPMEAASA